MASSASPYYTVVVVSVPSSTPSELVDLFISSGIALPTAFPAVLPGKFAPDVALELSARLGACGVLTELWPLSATFAYQTENISAVIDPVRAIRPEMKDTFLLLLDAGDKKIQAIKEVRTCTSMGLKEAKDLVDGVPSIIGQWTRSEARALVITFQEIGASVELVTDARQATGSLHDIVVERMKVASLEDLPRSLAIIFRNYTAPFEISTDTLIVSSVSTYIAENILKMIEESGGTARFEIAASPSDE